MGTGHIKEISHLLECSVRLYRLEVESLKNGASKKQIRNQAKVTDWKPFQCGLCPKMFCGQAKLDEHIRVHTGEKPFKCRFCDTMFRNLSTRGAHEKRNHELQQRVSCSYCDKTFTNYSSRASHEKVQHKGIGFPCSYCNRLSASRSERVQHERIHTGEKPYGCPCCERRFTQKVSMQVHLRIHTGEKPFKCDHCEEWVRTLGERNSHTRVHARLERHKKRGHDSRTPAVTVQQFTCSFCKKKYKRSCDLEQHVKTHTEIHNCNVCGKTFKQLDFKEWHKCVRTKPKRFACSYCFESFATTRDRNRHIATHSEADKQKLECSFCGKKFRFVCDLKPHVRTHTGEKPFKCRQCDRAFAQSGAHKKHERGHTSKEYFKFE